MMRSWLRVLGFILIATLVYAASAQLAAVAAGPLTHTPCRAGLFVVTCDLPTDGPPDWRVYAVAGGVIALLCAGTILFAKDWILYPFVILFGTLALGTIGYDLMFQNSLVSGPKLINDTFNVLRLLIFGSFTLTFILARRSRLSWLGMVAASLLSYGAALAAMFGFVIVRPELFGAFQLFVLYVAYAFGGFTLHLMTLSLLVSGARPAAREMSRSGLPLSRIG
jgi:hypothetical protein